MTKLLTMAGGFVTTLNDSEHNDRLDIATGAHSIMTCTLTLVVTHSLPNPRFMYMYVYVYM